MHSSADPTQVQPAAQAAFKVLGLTGEAIFTSPLITPWRSLPDRENCTLDATIDGAPVRWHVKRYPSSTARKRPAAAEVRGLQRLEEAGIATAPLVAWGELGDGRSFIITQDLAGYTPGDKWIAAGHPFDAILPQTAELAAKLHRSGFKHRDLYLCHFLVRDQAGAIDLRLIDAARVGELSFFTAGRWIIKDIAQFWYSTLYLKVTDDQREAWLRKYAEGRSLPGPLGLRAAMLRKVARIARHDEALRRKQPNRNISLPQ